MRQSEHFNLSLVEGTDKVNPLVTDVPNYEAIDAQLYANQQATVGTATELVSGNVHALTREAATPVFRFTATSNYNSGETFVVDGKQVTALTPSGEGLTSGAYIIGAEVLCMLRDTQLTILVSSIAVADNSLKLGGQLPDYYATAEAVATADGKATSAGTIANTANGLANTLNGQLTASGQKFYFDQKDGKFGYNTSSSRGADTFHPFSSGIDFSNVEYIRKTGAATITCQFTNKPKVIVYTLFAGTLARTVVFIPGKDYHFVNSYANGSNVSSQVRNNDPSSTSIMMVKSWDDNTNTITINGTSQAYMMFFGLY